MNKPSDLKSLVDWRANSSRLFSLVDLGVALDSVACITAIGKYESHPFECPKVMLRYN